MQKTQVRSLDWKDPLETGVEFLENSMDRGALQAPLSMEFSRNSTPVSRGSFQSRDRTWVFCIAGRFFSI